MIHLHAAALGPPHVCRFDKTGQCPSDPHASVELLKKHPVNEAARIKPENGIRHFLTIENSGHTTRTFLARVFVAFLCAQNLESQLVAEGSSKG